MVSRKPGKEVATELHPRMVIFADAARPATAKDMAIL
jgi:hypothetical protein